MEKYWPRDSYEPNHFYYHHELFAILTHSILDQDEILLSPNRQFYDRDSVTEFKTLILQYWQQIFPSFNPTVFPNKVKGDSTVEFQPMNKEASQASVYNIAYYIGYTM